MIFMSKDALTIEWVEKERAIYLGGYFTRSQDSHIETQLKALSFPTPGPLRIHCGAVSHMDSVGAWQLQHFIDSLESKGYGITFEALDAQYQTLLNLVRTHLSNAKKSQPFFPPWLWRVGAGFFKGCEESKDYFSFVGQLWFEFWHWLRHPEKIRWKGIFYTFELDGYDAIPIIALLSFLIGIVLAYQVGVQLRSYGANIYVVDLLGISILREFSPLLTAIILAGRTGSAYTAQLGTMTLNEEIDALRTLGLSPNELLVLPKVIALAMVLPLLTVLSELFSLGGGMIMARSMLGITFVDFLRRFGTQISFSTYVVGLIKTPVFAMLIASIGCFQGYRVTNSAESVGRHTTLSVVQGIFMIIVADAAFSILYTLLDI